MLFLEKLVTKAKIDINQALDISELNNVYLKYLGKKGHLTLYIATLRKLSSQERPIVGMACNKAKKQIQQALNIRKANLKNIAINRKLSSEIIDISLPGRRIENGGLHPVSYTIDRIENLFKTLGFSVIVGQEIEDDYHNFDALNISSHHPARNSHDTFWIDEKRLLRTQTSSVQIRILQTQKPPIRIIAPGRVYRKDYDQTHTPMFHQIEGFIIDKNISFSNLKSTLRNFLQKFFEGDLKIRFYPSYFPFTEPSAEIDIMDKNGKWLEVLGCGMIHPNVLRNVSIDPEIYSGFAFGIGIERLIMLRYNIADIRILFENDLRFLKQFK